MLTALLLAASFTTCNWNQPGHDRFTDQAAEFVMSHYTDIPQPERLQLATMIAKLRYTDRVAITRTEIKGGFEYAPTMWGMGFGASRYCQNIDRSQLPEDQAAMIFTVGQYSVGLAFVCGNPFRLSMIPSERPAALLAPVAELGAPEAVPLAGLPPGQFVAPAPFYEPVVPAGYVYAYLPPPLIYYPPPVFISGPPPLVLIPPIPEPSAFLMLLCGVILLYLFRNQRCTP